MKFSKAEIEQSIRKITKGSDMTRDEVTALAYVIRAYPKNVEAVTDFLMYANRIEPDIACRIDIYCEKIWEHTPSDDD